MEPEERCWGETTEPTCVTSPGSRQFPLTKPALLPPGALLIFFAYLSLTAQSY